MKLSPFPNIEYSSAIKCHRKIVILTTNIRLPLRPELYKSLHTITVYPGIYVMVAAQAPMTKSTARGCKPNAKPLDQHIHTIDVAGDLSAAETSLYDERCTC
jgi:hypothetical protein